MQREIGMTPAASCFTSPDIRANRAPSVLLWTVFASVVLLSSAAIMAAPIPDGVPRPIYTRQNQFSIPFQIDASTAAGISVTKVQLYVSENRGATWGRYAEIDPQQGRFTFRARRDGEYWFSVRTLNSQSSQTAVVAAPELVVVVDTVPPKLQLTALRGRAGELVAHWKITEPNLDPASLRVDYRSSDTAVPWQSLAIDPINPAEPGPAFAGRAIWWDQSGAGKTHVRVQVRDAAGNPAASEVTVPAGSQTASDIDQAHRPSQHGRYVDELSESSLATRKPWLPDQVASAPLSQSPDAPMRVSDPPQLADRFPGRVQPRVASPSSVAPRSGDAGTSRPAPQKEPNRQLDSQPSRERPIDPFSDEAFGARAGRSRRSTESSLANPPIANRFDPTDAGPTAFSLRDLPPGEQVRMINSKRFAIEYSLDLAPSEKRPVVELWGSRDGGRTWSRYATDEDGRSPVPVTVDQQGLYAFRLSSRASGQSESTPPGAGERPEIWIGVDWTQPEAELLRVEPGRGPDAGALRVAWQSSDERLGDQPAALYYSQGAGHSWTEITQGQQPAGSYAWRPPNGAATRFYVRLEVRDQAGNVATVDWPHLIMLEPPTAQGPTGGVTPYQNSTRGVRREQSYIR